MSNSFYHKDLTDSQWNKINLLFPKPKRVDRPALEPRIVINAVLWILRSGDATGIGTVFITNSVLPMIHH